MAQPLILPSFAAGVIAPSLYARVDLAKYHVGAALLRNHIVDYRGGAPNRPGTQFVGDTTDASQPTRLIPFVFSTIQAYVLVFSHFAMKVVKDGAFVIDHTTGLDFELATPYDAADLALLKFTQSADVLTLVHPSYQPRELTRTAHDAWALSVIDFAPQQPIVQGVTAMPSMTGDGTAYSYIVTAIGANGLTESLPSDVATALDSKTMSTTLGANQTVSWTAVPGAQLYNVYRSPEVASGAPAVGQFFGFVGSSNSTSFVDANIAPDFSRTPPQGFDPFGGTNDTGAVTGIAIIFQRGGYTGIPGLAFSGGGGSGAAATINFMSLFNAPLGNPGAGYVIGDVLDIPGGLAGFNAQIRVLAVDGAGAIQAYSTGPLGKYAVIPGPFVPLVGGTGAGAAVFAFFGMPVYSDGITLDDGGTEYRTAPTITVTGGGLPDNSTDLVASIIPFLNNNPSSTTYYQQRQVFAATEQEPQTFWMSKTGDFHNMGFSSPARADDSIVGTIAAQQVNAIKHMVPMQSLIMLSSSGAWKIDAGQPGVALTPSSLQALPQAYNGCSDVPPIVVNYDILYVQAKGAVVRDLAYNFYVNIYTGADMTVLANHLFQGHTILEWAYAEEPYKIVWAVRDDGVLLSFTFLKEQDVFAWAHHDTKGKFKSVAVIPEGNEDAVYLVVERYISGGKHQYIERMASRNMGAIPEGVSEALTSAVVPYTGKQRAVPADLTRAWFVDCGLQYPLTYPAATLTPSAITAPRTIGSVSVVAGGTGYVSPSIVVTDATGFGATFTVTVVAGIITAVTVVNPGTNYTRPTFTVSDSAGTGAIVTPQMTRDVLMAANATVFAPADVGAMVRVNNGWGRVRVYVSPASVIVNVLQPLANTWPAASGQWSCTRPVSTVTGLDHLEGETVSILADGNVHPRQQVNGGAVTLQEGASAIVIGLPYTAQFQSLYIDTGEVPTIQGKRKKIPAVSVRCQDSRGFRVGADFDHLDAPKERAFQLMGDPILPFTGDERVLCNSDWNVQGQVCVQQDDPLPVTILGLIPEITVGDSA